MTGFRNRLRVSDWWSSKIPPLLGVAYAAILMESVDGRVALPALARLLIAIVAIAGYGYVLNDVLDIEEDRRRGKANSMSGLSRWHHAALLVLLASASFAPVLSGPFGALSGTLVGVNLTLPMLYSIPPVRLKERGIPGVLADAMGAHFVPTLFFGVSIAGLGDASFSWRTTAFLAAASFLALVTGIRGILVHQVRDRESDRHAGVRTFAGELDLATARALVYRRIFPVEMLALAALLATVSPFAPILIAVVPLYLFFELLKVLDDWKLPLLDPGNPGAEPYVPVADNELYEVWLPLSLGLQLAASAPVFLSVPLFHLLAFLPNVRQRLGELLSLTPVLRWIATGRGRAPLSIAPYSDSAASARGLAPRSPEEPMTVFVGVPRFARNAVSAFAASLVRGLNERGIPASVLVGENDSTVRSGEIEESTRAGVPLVTFPKSEDSLRGADWAALVRFLEYQAPCIYVPMGGSRLASVTPLLSDKVGVVRAVHYDFDGVDRELGKVLEVKERMWNPEFRRVRGPLDRLKAFVRLSLTPGTGSR